MLLVGLMLTLMLQVRKDLVTAVRKNKERAASSTAYSEMLAAATGAEGAGYHKTNPMDHIVCY